MSASEIHLKRVSTVDISIIDDFGLESTELDFAGGPADEIRNRVGNHPRSQDHCLFLICHRNETVGFLCLREGRARPEWSSPEAMTLHNLRIDRSSRRSGFAGEAILASIRWIAEHRPDVLRLELSVNEQNGRAISLYRRCGFSRTGALHLGRLGPEIILSKPIAELVRKDST